jgi:hypothetical protein
MVVNPASERFLIEEWTSLTGVVGEAEPRTSIGSGGDYDVGS